MNKIKTLQVVLLMAMSVTFFSCIKEYNNPADGVLGQQITLFALRQAYQGKAITLDAATLGGASVIQGTVISDKDGLNTDPSSFIIQETVASSNSAGDVTRGIIVKLASGTAAYDPGDSLSVNVSGATLDRINGKLTVSGVQSSAITTIATGKVAQRTDVTLGLLSVWMDQYESTLVALHADVSDHAAGTTFAGLRKLRDHTGPEAYIHTRTEAAFANTQVPVNAQFTGIAGYLNESGNDTTGAKKVISMRNSSDVQFSSGALYAGFPESFESPDVSAKSSYNSGTNLVQLQTGTWYLLQGILANTILSDKIKLPGKQSIRMQQNLTTSGYTQMNFDLPDGASKVTVFYGKYATDARSSFRLEYSVNGGTTWTAVGANITDMPNKGNKQAAWTVNITGPVRFRINKLGIGTSNNGRLSLDDFAVYKKL
jgi:hypothetical protein